MRSSTTPTEAPRVAVLSARALASVAAETLQHGDKETGGLFLGHRCGAVWYIVESVDPGPASTREVTRFVYDQRYLNHLINKLRWYYQKPLGLLGLWHRHPGSFDRFSAPDQATNRRFLAEYPEGVLSALVNIDPDMRMTVYAIAGGGDRIIPFAAGEEIFPPALLAYRAAKNTASAQGFIERALSGSERIPDRWETSGSERIPDRWETSGSEGIPDRWEMSGSESSFGLRALSWGKCDFARQVRVSGEGVSDPSAPCGKENDSGPRVRSGIQDVCDLREPSVSSLEKLIEISESDIAFLTPLCGKLTMRAALDGSLEIDENGRRLLRLSGDASAAFLTVGNIRRRYSAGLIARSVAAYSLRRKGTSLL